VPSEKNYLVTFLSTGSAGEMYANTICVHDHDLSAGRSVQNVVDEVDTWLTTAYRGLLQTNATLNALRCFHIPAVYGDDSDVVTKLKGVAGTLAAGDGKMGREITLTLTLRSSHTTRRSQGRLSLPSPENSATLDSAGKWAAGVSYWINAATFGDALLAGRDIGLAGVDGHLSTRIYSRSDHKEGDSDPTYDVTSYLRQPRPRWLRRRVSIP